MNTKFSYLFVLLSVSETSFVLPPTNNQKKNKKMISVNYVKKICFLSFSKIVFCLIVYCRSCVFAISFNNFRARRVRQEMTITGPHKYSQITVFFSLLSSDY